MPRWVNVCRSKMGSWRLPVGRPPDRDAVPAGGVDHVLLHRDAGMAAVAEKDGGVDGVVFDAEYCYRNTAREALARVVAYGRAAARPITQWPIRGHSGRNSRVTISKPHSRHTHLKSPRAPPPWMR